MNRYIMYVTGNIVVTSGNHACTVNVYDKNVYIRLSLCLHYGNPWHGQGVQCSIEPVTMFIHSLK